MCVSSKGWRARPRLLRILMAEVRQTETFFPPSPSSHPKAVTQVRGSKAVGPVAKEESANKEKPLVLTGVCKLLDVLLLTGLRGDEQTSSEWVTLLQPQKKNELVSGRTSTSSHLNVLSLWSAGFCSTLD